MALLIIEKDVRSKRLENLRLFHAVHEMSLINAHFPRVQRADDALGSHLAPRSHERNTYGWLLRRLGRLETGQRPEEGREGTVLERLPHQSCLVLIKLLQAVQLNDLLRLVGKDHGIPVKRDTDLVDLLIAIGGRRVQAAGIPAHSASPTSASCADR